MKLLKWLAWVMRFVLPLTGWRVQVALLRGTARASDRQVVLLSAGRPSEFIIEHFFAQAPTVEQQTRVPIWRLQRLLNEWRSTADLTAAGLDWISARLFLDARHLAVPRWLSSWMKVPENLHDLTRTTPSIRADIQRVRVKKFECQCSREAKDFDLFYEKFYRPYITMRHGGAQKVAPRWILKLLFKRGMILWVMQNGERVAGEFITLEEKQFCKWVNGLLDGRRDLLQAGALGALYVHSIHEARRLGCTEINMGGSKPSLHDGVFRYKSKWTTDLRRHEGFISANCATFLDWNRLEGPVAEFLSQTSLIHHDKDGYSALWAFPPHEPLTAETLRHHYEKLKAPGLHRFRILLPSKAPSGFICPPEVRLVELAEAEKVGAGGITGLG